MADLTVSGIASSNAELIQSITNNRSQTKSDAEPEFASVLNQTNSIKGTQNLEMNSKKSNVVESTYSSEALSSQNSKDESYRNKIKTDDSKSETLGKNVSNDSKEVVKEYNDKIKKEVMSEMNVSEEELTEAMETLGLEYIQLLNPENLTKLAMELTGAENGLELLSDNGFGNLFQTLQDLTKNFIQDLNITPDAFNMAMEDNSFVDMLADNNISNNEFDVLGEINKEIDNQSINDFLETSDSTNVPINNSDKEALNGLANEIEKKVNKGIEEGTVEIVEETTDENDQLQLQNTEKESDTKEDGTDSQKDNSFSNKEDSKMENNSAVNFQNNFGEVRGDFAEYIPEQVSTVDTESIIKQINEFMKLNVSASTSSIEMQLNPENLGKIGLNVSLKQGMVTAQLSVENEQVKKALESQMLILRENMDAQGLKVEAVEVTIASHEFERNLDMNQSNGDAQAEEQKQNNSTRRNLLAADAIDNLSELSEGEQLAAKIMVQNGNSMDLTA